MIIKNNNFLKELIQLQEIKNKIFLIQNRLMKIQYMIKAHKKIIWMIL